MIIENFTDIVHQDGNGRNKMKETMIKKILTPGLDEAAYPGNIGFEEMVKFYELADKEQLKRMEKAIEKNDWSTFKSLIDEVVGTKLK